MLQLRKRWLFFFLLFHFLIPGKMAFAEEGSWIIKKGEWTYVNGNGKVIPGWVEYKGGWYFINAGRERMASGWIFDKGKWYFLSTNQKDLGKMQRFWATIDGYAYFFDENGAMAEKTVIQGKYAVNDNGQYLGEDGQPKYYEKSGFRTKPGTIMDELMAKAKKEAAQLSKAKITGRGNPTFTARYGLNPNGTYDPGPSNPWAEKEDVDMQKYDSKDDYIEDNSDSENDSEDDTDDYEEEEEEDEE